MVLTVDVTGIVNVAVEVVVDPVCVDVTVDVSVVALTPGEF